MLTDGTLLPDPFKVLVDQPADGCAEEWCWVPVAYAATEKQAIALAKAENVLWGDELDLVSHGKEWWRRDPAYKPTDAGYWRSEKENIDLDYEPWLPCSKYAKTGIEVWRLEVVEIAALPLPSTDHATEANDG